MILTLSKALIKLFNLSFELIMKTQLSPMILQRTEKAFISYSIELVIKNETLFSQVKILKASSIFQKRSPPKTVFDVVS